MISSTNALMKILENFKSSSEVVEKKLEDLTSQDILAEVIYSDRDLPPFNRVMMDGIAVHADKIDWKLPIKIIHEVFAGEDCQLSLGTNEAIQIATGAKLPDACNLVVQKELLKFENGECLFIGNDIPMAGKNIHFQGRDHKLDDVFFTKNHPINAGTIAALASIGKTKVKVFKGPQIKILATGNELKSPEETPTSTEIRDANTSLIKFKLNEIGIKAESIGIARDTHTDLKNKIQNGLDSDVFIITAGVSAGDKDLVPTVLKELGVEEIFYQVNLKPGKPLWFGRKDKTYVFGLPGNPFSVLVTLELFVLPLVKKMKNQPLAKTQKIKLAHDYMKKEQREEWMLAHFDNGFAELVPSSSSGDLVKMSLVNKIVKLNQGEKHFKEHEEVHWRDV